MNATTLENEENSSTSCKEYKKARKFNLDDEKIRSINDYLAEVDRARVGRWELEDHDGSNFVS